MINLVFTFIYGIATGSDLEEVRFRIISVTLLRPQGVHLLHEFIIPKRKYSLYTVAVFAGTVIVELTQASRTTCWSAPCCCPHS